MRVGRIRAHDTAEGHRVAAHGAAPNAKSSMCVSLNVFASSCCVVCILIPGLILTESFGSMGEQWQRCGRLTRCPKVPTEMYNGTATGGGVATDTVEGRASIYAANFVLELLLGLALLLVVAPLCGVGSIGIAKLEWTKHGCCCQGQPDCCCGIDARGFNCDKMVRSVGITLMLTSIVGGVYMIIAEATLEYLSDIYLLQSSIGFLVILATCLLSTAGCCACGASAISMASLYSCMHGGRFGEGGGGAGGGGYMGGGAGQPRSTAPVIPTAMIVQMADHHADARQQMELQQQQQQQQELAGGGGGDFECIPTVVVAVPIGGEHEDLPTAAVVAVTAQPLPQVTAQ